jgi:hypothetical protein
MTFLQQRSQAGFLRGCHGAAMRLTTDARHGPRGKIMVEKPR